MKPHKHAELIKQWADGAEIEVYSYFSEEWYDASLSPTWDDDIEFRIKPKPKWTPKYKLEAYEYKNIHPKPVLEENNLSDDVKSYWKLTKFVEEFETDWNKQYYEVFRDITGNYSMSANPNYYRPFGVIFMSKQCAEKLCDMLNNGEVEL